MRTFALIGNNLSHSFSEMFFKKKFKKEKIIKTKYINLELKDIKNIRSLIFNHKLSGLNVTVPFKQKIIPLLDDVSKEVKKIGAVNTIEIKQKKIIGHNTDIIGFKKSIIPLLNNRNKALILGDGGSAQAVKFVLSDLNIDYQTVTRNSVFDYCDINKKIIEKYSIIVNTTPLGMFPQTKKCPKIPFDLLSKQHLLFDLIYNPQETLFLKNGKKYNCEIKNGYEMLKIQAEESWNIWNR